MKQRTRRHERRRVDSKAGPPVTVRQLLWIAATQPGTEDGLVALDALGLADAALVSREAESLVLLAVGSLWDERLAAGRSDPARSPRRRSCRAADGHGSGRRSRPTGSVHAASGLGRPGGVARSPCRRIGVRLGRRVRPSQFLHQIALVQTIVTTLIAAYGAGRLHTIIPPPGTPVAPSMIDHDPTIHDPVLLRVRALLAQAESTTFEAEAEAFTAKAQELMARHAIDAAVLWSTTERSERPTTIRIPIDDPYVDIKSLLLQCVAGRSRCRAVWDDRHALATVVGFASDVASTEMLFTSLLVQAQSALQAEGARAGPGGRSRSRSFRSAFLMAFTHRIDQRLASINRAVEQTVDAEAGGSLLPVLASRASVVEDEVASLFGDLVTTPVRGGGDAAGWARGTLAADLAELNPAVATAPHTPAAIATETMS